MSADPDVVPGELATDDGGRDPHRLARCAAEPDVVWCQHHCGIFRSTDDGGSWTEIAEAGPSTFGFAVAAHPTDPLTAWFVPAVSDEVRVPVDGRLVVTRTRDGGESFEVLDAGLPARSYDLVYRHALDVDPTGERLLMGSTTGSLWWSDDAGDSWQLVSANLPRSTRCGSAETTRVLRPPSARRGSSRPRRTRRRPVTRPAAGGAR